MNKDDWILARAPVLVQFRLHPKAVKGDLFAILISDHGDLRPFLRDGRLICFADPDALPGILSMAGFDADRYIRAREDPWIVDWCAAADLLDHGVRDNKAILLTLINVVDDILNGLEVEIPIAYKTVLYTLAQWLTFHRAFGKFMERQHIDRAEALRSIEWCLGAIMLRIDLIETESCALRTVPQCDVGLSRAVQV